VLEQQNRILYTLFQQEPYLYNICVFCASSDTVSPSYHQAGTAFGYALAGHDCRLIFGGGSVGLMGTVAKAVKEKNGYVYGVIPSDLRGSEGRFSLCDRLILTDSLAERKKHMIDRADGFAVLPGGYGTLDEAFEVLTLRRHGLVHRPVVFLNTDGIFDSLIDFFERLNKEGFMQAAFMDEVRVTSDPEEAVVYLIDKGERI